MKPLTPTPPPSRSGDHNRHNREMLEETKRRGVNPYVRKYEEAVAKRVKARCDRLTGNK